MQRSVVRCSAKSAGTVKKVWNPAYLLLLYLGLFFLAACDQQQYQSLRVGSNIWPGYEPLYLARDLGYFNNTPVHLVELPSSTLTMHHLRSGTIDAACLTLDEVLSQIEAGLDLQVVLLLDYSNGADALVSQADIKTLQQLKGKTIGVENTAVGAILLDGALNKSGLALADVKLFSLQFDDQQQAFRQKRVDAVITFEPVKSRLEALGGNTLFDSSMIPGQIIDVLVVKKAYLQSYPDNVRSLIREYFRARDFMQKSPEKANSIMAGRLGVVADKVPLLFRGIKLLSLADNLKILDTDDPQFNQMAGELQQLLLTRKLLTRKVRINNLASAAYLPESMHE